MNPLLLLKGDTLGKTIYNTVAFVALLVGLSYLGFGLVTGKYYKWQAGRQEDRADRAESNLKVATKNADDANTGAAIGNETRGKMDKSTVDIRVFTDKGAGRVENYESDTANDDGTLPDDIVRELNAAHARARAAADQLQREGTR